MRNGKQMMASFVRKWSGKIESMYVIFVSKLSFTYQKAKSLYTIRLDQQFVWSDKDGSFY